MTYPGFVFRCESCRHAGAETTSDVSCCNVCGEMYDDGTLMADCYEEDKKMQYTVLRADSCRAYRRDDEKHNLFDMRGNYNVGDTFLFDGIEWTVTEIVARKER